MRRPIPAAITATVSGALIFGAGFWAGTLRENPPAAGSAPSGGGPATTFPGFERSGDPGTGGSAGGGIDPGDPGSAPVLSLTAALENPDAHRRERDLEVLGERDFRNGADWKAAAASIGDLVDRNRYLRGVITAWAAEAPKEATGHLSTLALGSRAELVPHAVSLWAVRDPAAAEAWVLALPGGEVRDRALDGLFRSWAALDPAEAASRSLSLADPSAMHRAFAAAVKEWSANDLESAGRWVERLDDPNLKDFATMAVADELSLRAPREAMRWASEHLRRDARANPDIVNLVAAKAGFEMPEETFAWLQTVPASPESASSLAGVAAYLAESDPAFAEERFPRLSDEVKQVAAAPVASVLAMQDPEAGKRWLGTLPEGETKRWATMAFASGWSGRDPDAAAAWVESLPAGPQKQAAAQGLENPGPGAGGGPGADPGSGGPRTP